MRLTPTDERRLRLFFDSPNPPAGRDPLLYRRIREAVIAAHPFATADGRPWPVDGLPPSYGIAREEAPGGYASSFPLSHLDAFHPG